MEKKYLFFDIDGTLTDRATGEIVPSAKEVLQRLEENGHFVAIATGRAHYKAENFTLAMAGVLSWMIQKIFIWKILYFEKSRRSSSFWTRISDVPAG